MFWIGGLLASPKRVAEAIDHSGLITSDYRFLKSLALSLQDTGRAFPVYAPSKARECNAMMKPDRGQPFPSPQPGADPKIEQDDAFEALDVPDHPYNPAHKLQRMLKGAVEPEQIPFSSEYPQHRLVEARIDRIASRVSRIAGPGLFAAALVALVVGLLQL